MNWYEIARGNVEAHLGDVCDDPDSIYDEAYTLASDALADAGCPRDLIGSISQEIAQSYAQP